MTTVLVIGGSGMLAALSRQLSKEFDVIGVLGRTKSKMDDLIKVQNVVPLYVDYTDSQNLKTVLNGFVEQYGKPSLVVGWIHSTAPDATLLVAGCCDDSFYEVTGRSGSENNHISHEHEKQIRQRGLKYHRVILRRKGNRWLRNGEISKGVYQAIQAGEPDFVVGEL